MQNIIKYQGHRVKCRLRELNQKGSAINHADSVSWTRLQHGIELVDLLICSGTARPCKPGDYSKFLHVKTDITISAIHRIYRLYTPFS